MIRIDFEDTYAVMNEDEDLMCAMFVAELKNEDIAVMQMRFDIIDLGLNFDVFNLTFGPVNSSGVINVMAKKRHEKIERLFSTILLQVLKFLERHPDAAVGIDGATEGRAYLYHRMFLTNCKNITKHCKAMGLDWYVRYLKSGDLETLEDGNFCVRQTIESLPSCRSTKDLFRYYLIAQSQFKLDNLWQTLKLYDKTF